MNAYELPVWQMSVDEVKALIETNRQQADRIAELEKKADRLSNHADELRKIHADRIAKLEKQSEPYCWIKPDKSVFRMRVEKPVQDVPLGWIALYTTPQTKPLSDEEIEEIIKDCIEDDYKMIANPYAVARAIEAKVRGEK